LTAKYELEILITNRKEFDDLTQAVAESDLFKKEIQKLNLPDWAEVIVEPWPYGGISDHLLSEEI
jgi:hypothetical protein